MPTSFERPDLKAFLGEHTPFQAMSDEELAELAAGSVVVEFPAGSLVADYATRVPDEVWMVHSGQVALRNSGDATTIDTVGSGGIFGYMPLLTGGGMDFEASTIGPATLIRLPGALVRAQFSKPAGLAFLASSAWNLGTADRPTIAPATDSRPVAELVHGEVLLVSPDTSVRDAVVRMTEHHVSYALIRLPDGGLGIFTDRDLRTRVVAAGLAVDVPIHRVMSAPARSVTADLTADAVLMEMLECGLRHMPVVTSRGEVVGVLEDADLLAASARQSFMLRRSIGLAATATELQKVGQRVTGLASELFRNGTKALATSGILSVVIDSLVRKALELALAETQDAPAGGFAWLTLGSVARREAMPSSDVDSALSWRDELSSASAQLRAIAARNHEILDGCGLPSDRNNAVASSPLFSRSQSEWFAAAEGWLDNPLRDRGLILSSLLLDGRVVWGDRGAAHGPLGLSPDARRASECTAAAAARGVVRQGPYALCAGCVVAPGRNVRPEESRRHADREPCALGWFDGRCDVGVDTHPAVRRRAGRCNQRTRRRNTVRRLRDAAAAEDGTPGRADVGRPHTGRRDHDVGVVAVEPQPAR